MRQDLRDIPDAALVLADFVADAERAPAGTRDCHARSQDAPGAAPLEPATQSRRLPIHRDLAGQALRGDVMRLPRGGPHLANDRAMPPLPDRRGESTPR